MVAVGQTFSAKGRTHPCRKKKILTGPRHGAFSFKGSINPAPWFCGLLTIALTG